MLSDLEEFDESLPDEEDEERQTIPERPSVHLDDDSEMNGVEENVKAEGESEEPDETLYGLADAKTAARESLLQVLSQKSNIEKTCKYMNLVKSFHTYKNIDNLGLGFHVIPPVDDWRYR